MIRKFRALGLLGIILLPLLLTGCFNYRDINRVTFSTSIIFDIDELGRTIIYLDCIKPYRSTNDSSDKGRRIIYKGEGKTVVEALSNINMISGYKLNYTQTKAYIFTERAAQKGIKKFLDLINDNNQFQMKSSAFVYYGDVQELLKTTSSDEEYLGLFLNELVKTDNDDIKFIKSNINYYLSNTLMGSNTLMLSAMDLKKDAIDQKVEIKGGAVFKNNKLVENIPLEDTIAYNLLTRNLRDGNLEIPNPQSNDGFITLQILESNVKDSLKYEDGKFKLIKNIEIAVSVAEAQEQFVVDSDVLNYITKNEEAFISEYAKFIFNKYKDKDLDLFDVERMVEVYYPKSEVANPLKYTDIEVNTKVKIKGTGVTRNSL